MRNPRQYFCRYVIDNKIIIELLKNYLFQHWLSAPLNYTELRSLVRDFDNKTYR